MELERHQQRQTYELCRLGFAILSLALVLACLPSILHLTQFFLGRRLWIWFSQWSWWTWIDVPIVWGSLVGVYLLWGRWNDTGWQRRTGLLVLMCLVDAVSWALDHGAEIGLRLNEIGNHLDWIRGQLGQALGWAEFTLIASLAADLMAHLGVEQSREASKATRALAATGAVVWMLSFCERTDWSRWPLQDKGIRTVESLLLYLGWNMIWTITLIQVTALTIAATKATSRVLAEIDREDREHDLFQSPSDSDFALLSTGAEGSSEDEGDGSQSSP